ncbi:MAG: glycosyltransferase family 4 protein [Chthoniobacterales bacterium]
MRLGIDASNLRAGGGITHLVGLLREANPQEHGISRVTVWGSSSTVAQVVAKSWLRQVEVPALNGALPSRTWWRRAELPRLAAADCDVLFSPGGGLITKIRPVITMFRNMLPFEPLERRRYGCSWMFLRLLLLHDAQLRSFRRAAGVIFLTEYAKSKVTTQAGRLHGCTAVIPHGIEESFRCSPRPQAAISEYSEQRPFRLLYISIVDVYKHQGTVARAVAQLRTEGLPLSLDLIGPAYPAALEGLKRVMQEVDATGSFIRYGGPVASADLPQLYRSADAFVFASSCENLPNILIEAMAAGLPIACSDRLPMPEVLGSDAGIYFNPEDVASIAAAVRNLVSDAALRERLAWTNYERAQSYSWRRCASETFAFVSKCARDYRRPPS